MRGLIGVLVALLIAGRAEAGLREVPVEFLRWNRGTDVNVAARVSKTVERIALGSSKTDSSTVIPVKDLFPAPLGGTSDASDTLRVMARLFLTSDSTAAGDMTAITVACHCVTGDHKALTVEQPQSVAIQSRSYTTMGSKRAYAFPIVQHLSPLPLSYIGDPSLTGGLLLCPAWRFVFSGITGTLGKVRGKLVYYSDRE